VRKKGGEREKKKEKKCVHTQERERQSERARARGEESVRVKANECTHVVIADELQRRVMRKHGKLPALQIEKYT
jgi:hypothetical protein